MLDAARFVLYNLLRNKEGIVQRAGKLERAFTYK